MRKYIYFILLSFFFVLIVSANVGSTNWLSDIPAETSGKPTLLLFYSSKSNDDELLDTTIFNNELFIQLSDSYNMVKVDIEDESTRNLIDKYGIYKTPTIALIKNDGTIHKKFDGKFTVEQLVTEMGQLVGTKFTGSTASSNSSTLTGFKTFAQDPSDVASNQRDIIEASYKIDGSDLILLIKYASNSEIDGFHFYVDSDNNTSTGFNAENCPGADYMVEGATLYSFGGNAQTDWKWNTLKNVQYELIQDKLIVKIPMSDVGIANNKNYRCSFITTDINWAVVDKMPDSKSANLPLGSPSALSIPTEISKPDVTKSASKKICSDKADVSSQQRDMSSASYSVEGDNLIIDIGFTSVAEIDGFHFMINSDNNTTTGYNTTNITGVDMMIEGALLYKFNGTNQTDWNWTNLKAVNYQIKGKQLTVTIPLSDLKLQRNQSYPISFFTAGADWMPVDFMPDTNPVLLKVE